MGVKEMIEVIDNIYAGLLVVVALVSCFCVLIESISNRGEIRRLHSKYKLLEDLNGKHIKDISEILVRVRELEYRVR